MRSSKHREEGRETERYTLLPLMKSISTFSPSKKPLALSRVGNRYLVTEPDLAGTENEGSNNLRGKKIKILCWTLNSIPQLEQFWFTQTELQSHKQLLLEQWEIFPAKLLKTFINAFFF